MKKISISIAGGSGYTGGELLRLLLFHPSVSVRQVTSERFAGKSIHRVHPNLRKLTNLKFCQLSDLEQCDLLFVCLPHGKSMLKIRDFQKTAKKIIDLSADFRLHRPDDYESWYGIPHSEPALLQKAVYGIPELHRKNIRKAGLVSGAGCNAAVSILALYPLYKNNIIDMDKTVIEVKCGSSEGGNSPSESSHHPIRSNCVRSYKPTNHRHSAELHQELGFGDPIQIHFSVTSLDIVRGALATCHVFLKEDLSEKDIWKIYRKEYSDEPFIRMVKEREGNYRYPEPKLLWGTNFCDIGFEKDKKTNRLVVIGAIDNLMKGAAGQAVQAMNIMSGFDETAGLRFPGLHPI
ncbi:N-acetyl-gamma-glutamyl-phosphate reductase [candidate division KSB1 bacterium]|nr:N-acetyl-gamma-glutamyl-phosphate reductase [candidate division KSB1 bacterium]